MSSRQGAAHRAGPCASDQVFDLYDLGDDSYRNFGRCFGTQRQTDRAVQARQLFRAQIEVFRQSLLAHLLVAP